MSFEFCVNNFYSLKHRYRRPGLPEEPRFTPSVHYITIHNYMPYELIIYLLLNKFSINLKLFGKNCELYQNRHLLNQIDFILNYPESNIIWKIVQGSPK